MSAAIEATARLIERHIDGDISAPVIARVLASLLELRRQYADDALAFEERFSLDQCRLSFDRRALPLLQDEPAPGEYRHRGFMGGQMS